MSMRKPVLILLIFCFAAVPGFAQNPASSDELLKAVRADMQGSKAALLGKNLTLSAEQAAKFWPLYEAYQKEQNVILDEQLKGIKQYVDQYNSLDDATAVSLLNAHFDRDTKMNALRKKWLAEFQKVLPTKLAVRAMQIDRRLSLAQQFEMSTHIPLSH
jgi:hypothetical protein